MGLKDLDIPFLRGSRVDMTELIFDSPFALSLKIKEFVDYSAIEVYKKILTDCLVKSIGIDAEVMPAFYDSCLVIENKKGLITLLAEAMYNGTELFIKYDSSAKMFVIVEDKKEKADIQAGKGAKGSVGVDFGNYLKSDLLELYYSLMYYILLSLNGQIRLANSIQIKIDGLRDRISKRDAKGVIPDAKALATALKKGNGVLIDANDLVEMLKLDTEPASKAMVIVYGRIADVLGVALSYVNGELAVGLGSEGGADVSMNEKGVLNFFYSVFKPCVEKLLGKTIDVDQENYTGLTENIKSILLLESCTLVDDAKKKEIVAKLLP